MSESNDTQGRTADQASAAPGEGAAPAGSSTAAPEARTGPADGAAKPGVDAPGAEEAQRQADGATGPAAGSQAGGKAGAEAKEGVDETETSSPKASKAKADDEEKRPHFKPQGMPDAEEEKKERPEGATGFIRDPSIGMADPESATHVSGDFLLMLMPDSMDDKLFTGKRMTVILGHKSKYIFDGDKVSKMMRAGAAVRSMETPDEIVVGRVGDASVDVDQARKVQAKRAQRNALNIDAVSVQAIAVLAAREKGSTEATPLVQALKAQFPEGTRAAIVGERLDALDDVDLKAFAEKRTGDVSKAASKMMAFGKESPDAQRAAEAKRDAFKGIGPDGSEPVETTGGAEGVAKPGAEAEQGAKPAEGVAPDAAAAPTAVEPIVPEATVPTTSVEAVAPASTEHAAEAAAPVVAPAIVPAPEASSRSEPAAAAPEATAPAEAAQAAPVAPSRPVLTLRTAPQVVAEPAAAIAPAANDPAPRTLTDQARQVSGEVPPTGRSKGVEAANDMANVIAFADRSKSRD